MGVGGPELCIPLRSLSDPGDADAVAEDKLSLLCWYGRFRKPNKGVVLDMPPCS